MALLLFILDAMQKHREVGHFLLHEFVVMPDHFHLIITPAEDVSLEKQVNTSREDFPSARSEN